MNPHSALIGDTYIERDISPAALNESSLSAATNSPLPALQRMSVHCGAKKEEEL
jgi:hypothetical protein